jgi:hypothetical protein
MCATTSAADAGHPGCAVAASATSTAKARRAAVPKAGHWYGLAALVVVLDQLSKWIVLENIRFGETIYVAPFWNWVLTWNPGAAFSFLADQPGWQRWFFTVLALAVSGWIAFELRKHPGAEAALAGPDAGHGRGAGQRHRPRALRRGRRFHSMACGRFLLAGLQRGRFRHYRRRGFARFRAVDPAGKKEAPR